MHLRFSHRQKEYTVISRLLWREVVYWSQRLTAQVNGSSENSQIAFVLKGETEQTITAELKDGTAVAQLTAETLKSLGESAEGTLELTADGQVIASIGVLYNIAIPEEDPYEIDGFENYYGVDSMLTNYWAVNKDTGCTINLALTAEKDKYLTASMR